MINKEQEFLGHYDIYEDIYTIGWEIFGGYREFDEWITAPDNEYNHDRNPEPLLEFLKNMLKEKKNNDGI